MSVGVVGTITDAGAGVSLKCTSKNKLSRLIQDHVGNIFMCKTSATVALMCYVTQLHFFTFTLCVYEVIRALIILLFFCPPQLLKCSRDLVPPGHQALVRFFSHIWCVDGN